MNVASLELSKELYELSGWEDLWYIKGEDDAEPWVYERRAAVSGYETLAPAYSLGFLLRKGEDLQISVRRTGGDGWEAECEHESIRTESGWNGEPGYEFESLTPEDAVTGLYIELFKQGVLSKGQRPVAPPNPNLTQDVFTRGES